MLAGAVLPLRQVDPGEDDRIELTASNTFEPKHLIVKAGVTVVWKNLSTRQHTVTSEGPGSVRSNVPKGASPLRSGEMAPGASYSYLFTVAGTYRYGCPDHTDVGMVGTVTVKPR